MYSGMVESCWTTDSLQVPWAASGPQTADWKSAITPSKYVLFQFVLGWLALHTCGVSSVTTTRGLANQGENRTYSAPRSASAAW